MIVVLANRIEVLIDILEEEEEEACCGKTLASKP